MEETGLNLRALFSTKNLASLFRLLFLPSAVAAALYIVLSGTMQLPFDTIHLRGEWVLLSFLVASGGMLFVALPTWRRILSTFGVDHSWRDDVRIYSYTALGAVLPGRIWTIVGRTAFYQRLGADGVQITVASLVESIVIGIAALGVYAVTTLISPQSSLLKIPALGGAVALLVLFLLHPAIFNRLLHWLASRTQNGASLVARLKMGFRFTDLVGWLVLETLVVCIGGLAIYLLLVSLVPLSGDLFVPVLASWAAGVVAGNLLWVPGTPLLRDGAMVLALSTQLPLPTTFVFVVLVRVWNIATLLLLVGLVWLFVQHGGRR